MASPDGSSDFRLEYIGAFVQKSLKLKPEKWGRLLLTEEYRNAVHDFLDNPLPAALFVALTPNAQLVACTSFPIPCQRTKGSTKFHIFVIIKELSKIFDDPKLPFTRYLRGEGGADAVAQRRGGLFIDAHSGRSVLSGRRSISHFDRQYLRSSVEQSGEPQGTA